MAASDPLGPLVSRLFARGAQRRTRLGVEHELIPVDAADGGVVPVARTRRAVQSLAHLTFEPGGQLELNLPCVPEDRLDATIAVALSAVRRDCAAAGIDVQAIPTDPRPDVPLQLRSERYAAMQRHFDTLGPAGRRMMRRTASTQVCLDWWPGSAGAEQWRLLNLAAPFLAAVLARESGPASRLATWLEVDRTRTAFDGRLVAGADPVAGYVDFARGATAFAEPHLSTLFPPIRPRGSYLEVRFPDVQPDAAIAPMAHALAHLLYDDEARVAALRAVSGEAPRLEQHWHDAAHGTGDLQERGELLLGRTRGLAGVA
jgi:gamma-glutamylcysteine synthetase